jgi:hypothetical protein
MRGVVLAVTLLAGSTGAAQGREVRCDYEQRIECTGAGCGSTAIEGRYLLMPTADALVRATAAARDASALPAIKVCDARGCTPIAVRAAASGAFVNVAQDGGAHFVKVAVRDVPSGPGGRTAIRRGSFVEVAAPFLSTVTHVGTCPALVP